MHPYIDKKEFQIMLNLVTLEGCRFSALGIFELPYNTPMRVTLH